MIRRMSGAQRFEFEADCAREDWHIGTPSPRFMVACALE